MSRVALTRQLVLETPQRVADGAGGYAESGRELGRRWAVVKAGSGREALAAGLPVGQVRYRIVVRGAPLGSPRRPRAGQRLRGGGRVFRVVAVAEADPGARFLTCHAQEEVAP